MKMSKTHILSFDFVLRLSIHVILTKYMSNLITYQESYYSKSCFVHQYKEETQGV